MIHMAEDSKKKKETGKHRKVKRWELYKIQDNKAVADNKSCPKCSKFLADMKGRKFCGSCGYTVFDNVKADAAPAQSSKEENKAEVKESKE